MSSKDLSKQIPPVIAKILARSGEWNWWKRDSCFPLDQVLKHINSYREKGQKGFQDLARGMELILTAAANDGPRSGNMMATISEWIQSQGHIPVPNLTGMEESIDVLFDRPSQRLAVYGSLKPGGSNAAQLDGIQGEWSDGTVQGIITQPGEYLELSWIPGGEFVSLMVFHAPKLCDSFARLDRFEGSDYLRTLVPVWIGTEIHVCNIYEGRGLSS